MRSIGIREYAVAEDGRTIELTFAVPDGDDLTITLDEFGAGRAAVDLTAAVTLAAQRSNLATAGVVAASTPKQFRVGPAEGEPETVLMSFRMPNETVYNYMLPSNVAKSLARQLLEAVETGRHSPPVRKQ